MSHWAFILGAYAFTGIATLLLVGLSYRAMRRAEAEAEALKGDK